MLLQKNLSKFVKYLLDIIKSNKSIGEDFFWKLGQVFLKQAYLAAVFFLAARLLDPFDFGELNYVFALSSLLLLFSDFGFSTTVSKLTAEKGEAEADNVLGAGIYLVGGVSFCLATIVFVYLFFFWGLELSYLIFFPYLLLVPLVSVLDGYYRAVGKFKKLFISVLLPALAVAPVSFYLIENFGKHGVFSLLSGYYLIAFFVLVPKKTLRFKKGVFLLRSISTYSFLVGLSSLAYYLYTKMDIIILNHFGFIVEIGYYEIVNKAFSIVHLPFILFGQVLGPRVSRAMKSSNWEIINSWFYKSSIGSFIVGLFFAPVFYFLVRIAVFYLLPEYNTSEFRLILLILSVMLPAYAFAGVMSQGFLFSLGYAKQSFYILLPFGLLNIILNYAFIHYWGFIGVFWSTLIVTSLTRIVAFIFLRKKLNDKRKS